MEGNKQQKTEMVWHVDRQVPMYVRLTKGSGDRISELQITFYGCRRVQID